MVSTYGEPGIPTVDARTNTGTGGGGGFAMFRLDSVMLADDYDELIDGGRPFRSGFYLTVDETGVNHTSNKSVWTGTNHDLTANTGRGTLGDPDGMAASGKTIGESGHWGSDTRSTGSSQVFYAMSEPLSILQDATYWIDGTNVWGTVAEWDNGVPSSVKDAFVQTASANSVVTVDAGGAAYSLEIGDNVPGAFSSTVIVDPGQTLTVTDRLNVLGNGTLTVDGILTLTNGTLNTAGTTNLHGSETLDAINITAGTLDIDHNFAATSFSATGGSVALNNNDLTVTDLALGVDLNMGTGTLAASNSIAVTGGTLTTNGVQDLATATLNFYGAGLVLGGKNLNVTDLTLGVDLNIGTGTLAASNSIAANAGTLTTNGTQNLSTAIVNLAGGSLALGIGDLTATSGLTLTGSSLAFDGTSPTGANPTGSHLTATGAAVTINSGGTLSVADALVADSLIVNTGGTFIQTGDATKNERDVTVTTALTLNGDLNLTGGALNAGANANVTVQNGATLTLDPGQTPLTVDSLSIDSSAIVGGTISATTRYDFNGTMTYNGNLAANAAEVHIGERDNSDGTVTLGGTNQYTGKTRIERGVLRADDGVGLPAGISGSWLQFQSNNNEQLAVLESSGTFRRNIGGDPGEVRWDDRGGFSAAGGALTVTLEPADAGDLKGTDLTWSSSTVGFSNRTAVLFGSHSADSMVELTNNIDMGNTTRRFQIANNTTTKGDLVRLSGNITAAGADNNDYLTFNLRFRGRLCLSVSCHAARSKSRRRKPGNSAQQFSPRTVIPQFPIWMYLKRLRARDNAIFISWKFREIGIDECNGYPVNNLGQVTKPLYGRDPNAFTDKV